MPAFTESVVEDAALDWLKSLGYAVKGGPDISPGGKDVERDSYQKVILEDRLRQALTRLNPTLPAEALEDAFRKLTRTIAPGLVPANHAMHQMLVAGVNVEFRRRDGSIGGTQVNVLDFETPDNNDWLAVNQFTVQENRHNRRPDIVLFVNGLSLAVLELKNAADEDATTRSAYGQLQTYKNEIPSLFNTNAVMVISDGAQARIGTLTSDFERFMPWRTIEGLEPAKPSLSEMQVLLEGVFEKKRFLDLIRHFIVYEDFVPGGLAKKIAGYHQYHAVNVAVQETLRASLLSQQLAERQGRYESGARPGGAPGDKRIGVIWHTQGAGKSLTMVFYAGRLILHPQMSNPTVVVVTDRNDLDGQLFDTFARCRELLRQPPSQAESRSDLRAKLNTAGGGVIFTTVQKFMPEEKDGKNQALSDRRNIVVIADEAHRSQYDFIDGLARHLHDALPNASFIGFTGTPLELDDRNTRSVFGDYISIYDIQKAVEDGATVPIYYESRLAKLDLKESERPKIDPRFEEVTEGEEVERKERLKTRWAQLEAVVGTDKRIKLIAEDFVRHFEQRLGNLQGKAMIVCMSRRICVDMYNAITALRPQWQSSDDDKGEIKVVMTGSASETDWQMHIRNKSRREDLAKRFRDPDDPFKVVIVRDMWLTGFDAPSLHTMYVDKPMQGHALMQAIARVNRVFKDKPGGLVVDYLGLADELRKAINDYTQSGGTGKTAIDQEEAVAALKEKYEICRGLFHGFSWTLWVSGTPQQKLSLLPQAQEHILKLKDGKDRLMQAVSDLSKAFALAVPHEETLRIRDDVGFFQAVRSVMAKNAPGERKSDEDLDHAIRQIVSQAIVSDDVVDVFAAAGLKKPDISILSDQFLAEVRGMPQRNLAVELLQKLLRGEIKAKSRKNVIQSKSFMAMLEQAIRRYQNRAIETAQVIEELIALAKEMRAANARGEALGLSEDEIAFYDALEANDSAVKVLGEPTLQMIARELAETVKRNVAIDWTVRENVRAQLRVLVKRILRKYGYPPDKQERATDLVIEQAEVLSVGWSVA